MRLPHLVTILLLATSVLAPAASEARGNPQAVKAAQLARSIATISNPRTRTLKLRTLGRYVAKAGLAHTAKLAMLKSALASEAADEDRRAAREYRRAAREAAAEAPAAGTE